MAQFEGSDCMLIIQDNSDFPVLEAPVVAGFRLPYQSASVSPNRGRVDIPKIDGTQNPRPKGRGKLDVSGSIRYPLHILSCGHVFRHWIADPVDAGAGDPYTHTFTLGHVNGLPIGMQLIFQQIAGAKERLFYGVRASSMAFSIDVEGGVIFDLGVVGVNASGWGADTIVSVTEYTEDAVDTMIGTFKIAGVAAPNRVSNFTVNLNRNLHTDNYAICSGGVRASVPRGVPTLDGTLDAFLGDEAIADLIAAAEANTTLDFDVEYEIAAGPPARSIKFALNNCYVDITGEPIETDAGRNVTFGWHCSGAAAFVVEVINSIATYG